MCIRDSTSAGHDPYDCTSQDCAVDFTEHLNDSIEGKRVGIIPAFMEAEGLSLIHIYGVC